MSEQLATLQQAIDLRLARDTERCMRELGFDYSYVDDPSWGFAPSIEASNNEGEAAALLAQVEELRLALEWEAAEDDYSNAVDYETDEFEDAMIDCTTESPANVSHPFVDDTSEVFTDVRKTASDSTKADPAVIEANSRYAECLASTGYEDINVELNELRAELSTAWELPADEASQYLDDIESKALRLEDASRGCGYHDMLAVRRQVHAAMMKKHFDENPELSLWLGEVAAMIDDYQSELIEVQSETGG